MEFRLLGSVDASVDGTPVKVGRRQERCLLALLLLEAGRFVSHGRLAELLWDADPPNGARAVLQTYVARLRAVLAVHGVAITSGPAGFRVDVDPLSIDVHRFRAAIIEARGTEDRGVKTDTLRQALVLWRGPLMVGVATEALRERIGVEFDELRIEAITMLADAEIAGGHADRAVDLLRPEVAADPLRETLVGQLMTAFRAAGRQSAAVALYHETRSRLIDTLGLQPGPALRAQYADLLRDDASDATGAPLRHAAQLPAGVRRFSGRAAELRRLDELAAEQGAAVVISAMSGLGGIGKTALALHWAHQVRDRFPDGQLYVDLRGFDPRMPPLDPADALRGFLDALGVRQPPAGLDAMAARYRSILADRSVLVLLDNARDATHVQHLLPGARSCLTLVTSRHQLTALVALSGARVLTVDRLPDPDARALLAAHLGAARLAAEPEAVEDLLAACAGLPLALSVLAAQLATNPGVRIADLTAHLDAGGRLASLDAGEPAADVRTVFSLSYRSLRPAVAQAFRLLGLHPTPTFDGYAVASLLAAPPTHAENILTELTLNNLVVPTVPGWYAMHDLVHAYAGELAEAVDPEPVRASALRRLTDHYTHTGAAADRAIDPARDPHRTDAPAPGVSRTPLATFEEAMTWFAAAKPAMVALFHQTVKAGADEAFWHLGAVMSSYLDRMSSWADLEAIQLPILEFARRAGRHGARLAAHQAIARAHIRRGDLDQATPHLLDSLAVLDDTDTGELAAAMHNEIATLYAARGDNAQALAHVRQALDGLAKTTDSALLARTLNGVGWFHAQLGEYDQALLHCTEAARILHDVGDVFGEADTLDSLGYAHSRLGDHARARMCFEEAFELFRRTGDALQMANVLDHRGDAEAADGDTAAARSSWRAAADLFDQIHRPEGDAVRAKLTS